MATLIVANPVAAQVFRCTEGGRTVYSDKPCADATKSVTVPIPSRAPETSGPNLQAEAKLGRVAIGMTPSQVETAWGKPRSINTTTTADGRTDQWVYRRDAGDAYVHFRRGVVSSISTQSEPAQASQPSIDLPLPPLTLSEREAMERADKGSERKHVPEGLVSANVRARLGEPDRKGRSGGLDYWTYRPTGQDPQTRTTIWFQGGRVLRVEREIER